MNEELTREVLEAIKKCNETHCNECLAVGVCCSEDDVTIGERLATALLEEIDKPKVWDGAPEWATIGRVYWTSGYDKEAYSKLYNRELPKTRARQIAENIVHGINGETHGETKDIEYVEGVLNKYAEELEGKE